MRLGFVTEALPYLPSRDGFRIHAANLIRCLSRQHTVDLVSLEAEGDSKHLDWARRYCASVTLVPARRHGLPERASNFWSAYWLGRPLHFREQLGAAVRSGLRERKWDVLHVEGTFAGGLVAGDLPVAKVLALHDSQVLRCEEMLKCPLTARERAYYTILKWQEPRYQRLVYPRFERCTVVTSRDEAAIHGVAPRASLTVIPNGTDTEYFHPLPVEKEAATLVFHGHLGYGPNVASAQELANSVLPAVQRGFPGATLHLVGANPSREVVDLGSRAGIRLSANLPDLRQAVCSGQVYVCAVRHGSGIKNKLLEAMAMEMPVATAPESVVGIDCVAGKHLLVGETPAQLAEVVLDLLRTPERARQIAEAGRKLVAEQYAWETQSLHYEALYHTVIGEREGRIGLSGQIRSA